MGWFSWNAWMSKAGLRRNASQVVGALPAPSLPEEAEITFGRDVEHAALRIRALPDFDISFPSQRLDTKRAGLDRLGPLLQAIPGLVVAGDVKASRYMEVVVDGALALDRSKEFYHPFVRGSKGRIEDTAKLLNPERLHDLVNAAALYNVVNFVAAQKHLADISAKLTQLQKGVDAIAWHLKEQQKSIVTTALRTYQEYAAVILQGNREPAVRQQLEATGADLAAINNMMLKEFQANVVAARKTEPASAFNLLAHLTGDTEFVVKARADRDALRDLADSWRQCMQVRIAGLQLTAAFSDTEPLVKARLESLRAEIAEFEVEVVDGARVLKDHVVSSLSADHGDRDDLVHRGSANRFLGDMESYQRAVRGVESLLNSRQRKVTLVIQVDASGQVTEAHEPTPWDLAKLAASQVVRTAGSSATSGESSAPAAGRIF